ncbi:MAG: DUF420 domain-containing protein [Halanaeroarchaeum sp.]
MDAADADRSVATRRPRVVTAVVSVVGYAVVAASFLDLIPVPDLAPETVTLFSHLIAVVNASALVAIVAGVAFVRRGSIERHRRSMLLAFGLILVFLTLYVWKQAGGFTKGLVIEEGQFLAAYAGLVNATYLLMLAVHVLLSALAVPFVLHAVVLGLTQPVDRLPETAHPTVGRIAVAAWTISLALGILTYLALNHVYSWRPIQAAALLAIGVPIRARSR